MTQIYIKQNIGHKIFEELVPSVSPLLKKRHAGIVDHFVDLSIPDLEKVYKKEMDRSNKKKIKKNKCITANPSAAYCTYHQPTYFFQLLNRSHSKSLSLNEKYWKDFLEKVQENGPAGRKRIRQKE